MRAALLNEEGNRAPRMQAFWVPPTEPSTTVVDLAAYRAAR
jgi:hypothetical protein